MEETVGATRKSRRTPVPKKSFDLVEEYDVRPSVGVHATKSTSDSTPSREQKRQPKGPALIKISRKKAPKAKKESPIKEQPDAEPKEITKIQKEKISSKKRKYSAVEKEDLQPTSSDKNETGSARQMSPLKLTLPILKELPIAEPDALKLAHDDANSSPSKKKKRNKSKSGFTKKEKVDNAEDSGLEKQKLEASDIEKVVPVTNEENMAVSPGYVEGMKPKKLKSEQKQTPGRTTTESDAFITSCNLIPEKKSKKKLTKSPKPQQKNATTVSNSNSMSTDDLKSTDIDQSLAEKDVTHQEHIGSKVEGEKAAAISLLQNDRKLLESSSMKKEKQERSTQKKHEGKTKAPLDQQPKLLIASDSVESIEETNAKQTEESMVELPVGIEIPEDSKATHLKMKKRKVYKRKHGERVLVRIVTELYDESGKVIDSTVEEVKGKHEQTKKAKPPKSNKKSKDTEKKTDEFKKSDLSNENNETLAAVVEEGQQQSVSAELPSPSKKRMEGGGKEFKKMQTLTAYILYCRKHRKRVVQQHPNFDFSQISKKLGEMWNNTSEPEKEIYRIQLEEHKAKVHSALRKIKLKTTGFSDENDASIDDDLPSSIRLMKKRDAKEQVSIPQYSTTNLEPIDFASHLVLLGESLTMISSALFQQDQQTVHGSLSVLLDSCLCALTPLLFLTSSVPEIDSLPEELMANTLDHVSYILPGV